MTKETELKELLKFYDYSIYMVNKGDMPSSFPMQHAFDKNGEEKNVLHNGETSHVEAGKKYISPNTATYIATYSRKVSGFGTANTTVEEIYLTDEANIAELASLLNSLVGK